MAVAPWRIACHPKPYGCGEHSCCHVRGLSGSASATDNYPRLDSWGCCIEVNDPTKLLRSVGLWLVESSSRTGNLASASRRVNSKDLLGLRECEACCSNSCRSKKIVPVHSRLLEPEILISNSYGRIASHDLLGRARRGP